MLARILVGYFFGGFWEFRAALICKKYKFFQKIFEKLYQEYLWNWGSYIPLSVKFSGPACFPHGPASIFISGAAVIGKDAVIFQQVTIGSNSLENSKRNGSPCLGDNVYIGAGAKIIGAVTLGNNILVGANAVVTRDIPSNSTVVENNKIITREKILDNYYITYIKGRKVIFIDGKFVDFDMKSGSSSSFR